MSSTGDSDGPGADVPVEERPTISVDSTQTDDIRAIIAETEAPPVDRSSVIPRFPHEVRAIKMPPRGEPRFVEEYCAIFLRSGPAKFRAAYDHCFLVGVGTVGDLNTAPMSSTKRMMTSEVVLDDFTQEAYASPAWGGRVWKVTEGVHNVEVGTASLGRSANNDLIIPEFAISREHCKFHLLVRRTKVEDLGSRNGTVLNEQRLQPEQLYEIDNHDILILGRFKFQFFTCIGFINELTTRLREQGLLPDPKVK